MFSSRGQVDKQLHGGERTLEKERGRPKFQERQAWDLGQHQQEKEIEGEKCIFSELRKAGKLSWLKEAP